MALLCELLAGEPAVIVIDGRAVLEDLVARAARLHPTPAPSLAGYPPSPPPSPVDLWRERWRALSDEFEAEWDEVDDGGDFDFRHRQTGELLEYEEYYQRREAWIAARLVAEGLPAEEPEERAVFDRGDG